ncbi:MAG: ABC-F type ribosomal protection protein [Lachnospiraceae bacterium]
MILSCQAIEKSFVEQPVLSNCSFHIEEYDKAAIVGMNGAGKSTLLKIIVGELMPDGGQVTFAKDKSFGYLPQYQALTTDNTIYEEMLSVKQDMIDLERKIRVTEHLMNTAVGEELEALLVTYTNLTHYFESGNGYAYKSEVIGILKGLGFMEDEFGKSVTALSGGQKTRIALGKILLQKPNLILLDEPTNHLDLSSIAWLETYLLNYKGAVVIVSHDRYFLNKITNKIIEIDHAQVTVFNGNYSAYADKKEMLRTAALNAYLNQQAEIKHQEEVITKLKSFNREKSIKRAESREKMLDKITLIEKPIESNHEMHMQIHPKTISGGDVLSVSHLSKAYDSETLFTDLNFEIKRGEHVSIIGDNGTGKTTILKIINGLVCADTGTTTLGTNVHIGYYDQEHHVLHMDKTLFEEISDDYETLTNTEIRNTLAAFLFTGDDVFKRIKDLSGGERGRCSLAKLMLSEANFLILDEPTNHLDITSKEILEDALNHYTGTVLYVSHDRYFINKTASRILDLHLGQLTNYLGDYDYYLEKKDTLSALDSDDDTTTAPTDTATKLDWKQQKEAQAQSRKKEAELSKTESAIEQLEAQNAHIDAQMILPEIATDVAALQSLSKEQATITDELEALYERWEILSGDDLI